MPPKTLNYLYHKFLIDGRIISGKIRVCKKRINGGFKKIQALGLPLLFWGWQIW